MEKHIYIMFSHTNTKMGKIIQFFSNYTYNHVSISVDSSLQPLYSFARYHYNAALVGGFVEESPLRYIWDGRDTTIRIYDLVISEEQFKKFEIIISLYSQKSTQYIYDHFYFFRKDTCRSKYQHTCLSFVVDILKDLQILPNDTKIKTIKALTTALSCFPYTDTKLYRESDTQYTWGNDKYYENIPLPNIFVSTCQHFRKLVS